MMTIVCSERKREMNTDICKQKYCKFSFALIYAWITMDFLILLCFIF